MNNSGLTAVHIVLFPDVALVELIVWFIPEELFPFFAGAVAPGKPSKSLSQY